jgi:hypothetical protein
MYIPQKYGHELQAKEIAFFLMQRFSTFIR